MKRHNKFWENSETAKQWNEILYGPYSLKSFASLRDKVFNVTVGTYQYKWNFNAIKQIAKRRGTMRITKVIQ